MKAGTWDVIVIGGGPAGLSGALVLGRCLRRVVVVDDGRPRNFAAHASHGFFTRDGEHPDELRELGRAQLRPYGVRFIKDRALAAERDADGRFHVSLEKGKPLHARRLLVATGLCDRLPDIPGAAALYGRGLHHCAYCDGYEHRGQRLAALGDDAWAVDEALSLRTWSEDVTLLTGGRPKLTREQLRKLARNDIPVVTGGLVRLEARRGRLSGVRFEDGQTRPVDALFFHPRPQQRCVVAGSLGCDFTRHGTIKTGKGETTNIEGLYAAGDASRDVQQISIAVAEGTKAAMSINRSLRLEDER